MVKHGTIPWPWHQLEICLDGYSRLFTSSGTQHPWRLIRVNVPLDNHNSSNGVTVLIGNLQRRLEKIQKNCKVFGKICKCLPEANLRVGTHSDDVKPLVPLCIVMTLSVKKRAWEGNCAQRGVSTGQTGGQYLVTQPIPSALIENQSTRPNFRHSCYNFLVMHHLVLSDEEVFCVWHGLYCVSLCARWTAGPLECCCTHWCIAVCHLMGPVMPPSQNKSVKAATADPTPHQVEDGYLFSPSR